MKNRGSTPILTNSIGVHPRNIHTKFEANPCSGLRLEVEKLKSSRRQQRQRQRRRRRRTQPDRYSHTHSLSVTKNFGSTPLRNDPRSTENVADFSAQKITVLCDSSAYIVIANSQYMYSNQSSFEMRCLFFKSIIVI